MANRSHEEFSFPPYAADEIAALVKYSDKLPDLIAKSQSQKPQVHFSSMLKSLSTEVGIPFAEMNVVLRALDNFRQVKREFDDWQNIAKKIGDGLGKELGKKWQENEKKISEALDSFSDDNPLSISIKAQRLAVLRENVYTTAEIITDARPIYSSAGDRILEMIITHSLVATFYDSKFERSRIHLAMDAADLLQLRRACDRAIIKATTLKNTLDKASDWNVEILRDENEIS